MPGSKGKGKKRAINPPPLGFINLVITNNIAVQVVVSVVNGDTLVAVLTAPSDPVSNLDVQFSIDGVVVGTVSSAKKRFSATATLPVSPPVTPGSTVTATITTAGYFGTGSIVFNNAASASGDPHIKGPFGEYIDFYGKPGGKYVLFDAPQFSINMELAREGPRNHYITALAIVFQNATLFFDTHPHNVGFLARMQQQLRPLGAEASYVNGNKNIALVNLCAGVSVKVTQLHTAQTGVEMHWPYLNVELDIPGCHDDFAGVLGQMYRCQYRHGSFAWSSTLEETFRVPKLRPAPKNAPCFERQHYGPAFASTAHAGSEPSHK